MTQDKTVVDNTPTAILATEMIRTPVAVNRRNKRETVEEALSASLSAEVNIQTNLKSKMQILTFKIGEEVFYSPRRPHGSHRSPRPSSPANRSEDT